MKTTLKLWVIMMTSIVLVSACSDGGDKEWMTENLNVDTFRNGDPIPQAKTEEEWKKAGENGQPAWCYYDNNPMNGPLFGKLYNWYAVNDPRGLAPEGWAIPSDEDWTALTDKLGGEKVAGGKMKSTDMRFWSSPNNEATNESGFSALPAGTQGSGGMFRAGFFAFWWSSTEDEDGNAWYRSVNFNSGEVTRNYREKGHGFSVRCVKD